MILYFIDGRIDIFETNSEYTELASAYSIDAADGVRANYDELNTIDNISYSNKDDDYVIISNQVLFLNEADIIYIYNEDTKEFDKWDYPRKDTPSRLEIYLKNLYNFD